MKNALEELIVTKGDNMELLKILNSFGRSRKRNKENKE